MSFESQLLENIKKLNNKIHDRERTIRDKWASAGEDCNCDCDKCSYAHEDIDEDEIHELEAALKEWQRELRLLKAKAVDYGHLTV